MWSSRGGRLDYNIVLPRRMVNSVLAEEMKEIHAFQMKTMTPEQWEKQKS